MALNPSIGGGGKFLRPRVYAVTWPQDIVNYPLPSNGTVINFPGIRHDSGLTEGTTAKTVGGTGALYWGTGTGYRGRPVMVYTAGAGGFVRSQVQQIDLTVAMEPSVEPDLIDSDEHAFKRAYIIAAFEDAGGFALGNGFHFSATQAGNPDLYGGAMGFGFQRTASGVISVVSRAALGAGAVVTHAQFAPGAAALTHFNVYEIRAHPARYNIPAKMEFLVNGQLLASRKVGTPADVGMPTNPMHSTGAYGWGLTINCLNNNNQLAVARVRHIMGPTLESVLGR